VQAIKAGILEIADIFAVNKADRDGADRTIMGLTMMLNLGAPEKHRIMHHGRLLPVETPDVVSELEAWHPPIISTVATKQQGIVELIDEVESHRQYLQESGNLQLREQFRAATSLRMILRDYLLERLLDAAGYDPINQIVQDVAARRVDPYTAASQLVDQYCA
jgi:LAO/AO transport system kinase